MRNFSSGAKKVTITFLICFVSLIGYIAYFQVFKAAQLEAKGAECDGTNPRDIELEEKILRGKIYDVKGNIIAESVRKENGNQTRKYPYGQLYGSVVGYYGLNYGSNGLERELHKNLIKYEEEPLKLEEFNLDKYFEEKNKERIGGGVVTTLDSELQKVAYQAMEDAVYSNGSKYIEGFDGSVVAINPKTGDILAMVSKPTYDANKLDEIMELAQEDSNSGMLINKATQGNYPPGSIFKTLTMATAIEKTPSVVRRTFKDPGYLDPIDFLPKDKQEEARKNQDNDYVLYNFDSTGKAKNQRHDYGDVSLEFAYRYSSNVVFGTLGIELDSVYMKDSAEKYGFNEVIKGIGITANASNFPLVNSYGDIAQCAIGQHQVTATPLQMAMVGAAVVNDGKLMKPKIIKGYTDENGQIIQNVEPEIMVDNIISAETSKEVRKIMRNVVEKNENSPGYPTFAEFRGTNAGGKTGTADWIDPETGDISKEPHGWFLAAAPMENPEIVVAVICEKGMSGSQPGAYVSGKVIKHYLDNR